MVGMCPASVRPPGSAGGVGIAPSPCRVDGPRQGPNAKPPCYANQPQREWRARIS